MSVNFTDNSVAVENAIKEAAIAWLHEAGGEVQGQTMRNSTIGKLYGGQTKGSWSYKVNESDLRVAIGSTSENAIWEELGTGEYALNGDGRKGGWFVCIGNGSGQISPAIVEKYKFKIYYGKNGKRFIFVKGKKPKRMLFRAFTSLKSKIIDSAKEKLKVALHD